MSDDRPSGRFVLAVLAVLVIVATTLVLLGRSGSSQLQPSSSPPLLKTGRGCVHYLNQHPYPQTTAYGFTMGPNDLAQLKSERSGDRWLFRGTMSGKRHSVSQLLSFRFVCITDEFGRVQSAKPFGLAQLL